MSADNFKYVGNELALFEGAQQWKAYLAHQLRPYLRGSVLEVGAGTGATTEALWAPTVRRWTALEPDAGLAAEARRRLQGQPLCSIRVGTVTDLPPADVFDAILYIDVLEHIADDRAELERAAVHLGPGGFLAVMSPAHQWLFSPFDEAIGHVRRYTRRTLRAAGPEGLPLVRLRYLDAAGMTASFANRLLLRQSMPSASQLAVWDRYMVPMSRLLDPCTGYLLGKSVLGVWQRRAG